MLRYLCLIVCFFLFAVPQSSVMAQDPPPLSAPTDLSASVSAEGITLTWTAPDGQVDGYEILRQRPLQGETDLTTLVDDTGDSETSYSDTTATTPGERYVYGVKTIRGADRSAESDSVTVDFITINCEIVTGDNHDILQCTANAGEIAITSATWTPSFEAQYAQTTSRPAATWVIADEYCGQSTTVTVAAQSGESVFLTVETTITLECSPEPTDDLTVSCENLVENERAHPEMLVKRRRSNHSTAPPGSPISRLRTRKQQKETKRGKRPGSSAMRIIAAKPRRWMWICYLAGETSLPTVSTTVPLHCVIRVDDNCSLANAIRSANGNAQVEESGDSDGNDDCEAGGAPDDSATPPDTGDDIILLKKNVTLTASLPVHNEPRSARGQRLYHLRRCRTPASSMVSWRSAKRQ